jgi:phosphoglycerate dehydrogenase-like enzyme
VKTILFLFELKDEVINELNNAAPDWRVIYGKGNDAWKNTISEAEIIVGWNKEVNAWFKAHPNPSDLPLRWVHTWSAGVDDIPFELFKKHRLLLSNSSGVHAYPISETIFAMMLGFTRKIPQYVRNQQTKTWHHAKLGYEMHEKTLGLIGVGSIGQETAKIAKAFGMKVLGVRRSGKSSEDVDHMYRIDELSSMLGLCDYIVVCLPATSETYHLFSKNEFAQMKSNAFFVNVGRGDTVDTTALTEALQHGVIAGAGLDVFEEEPLPANHPLWELEQVIISPHTSGSTQYYNERAMHIFLENLNQYLSDGRLIKNEVDLVRQY